MDVYLFIHLISERVGICGVGINHPPCLDNIIDKIYYQSIQCDIVARGWDVESHVDNFIPFPGEAFDRHWVRTGHRCSM